MVNGWSSGRLPGPISAWGPGRHRTPTGGERARPGLPAPDPTDVDLSQGDHMSREHRGTRAAAWVVLAALAVAVAHRGFGPGAELATLRAREAELCRRYEALASVIAAEAARAGVKTDECRPSCVPETVRVIEDLRRVRNRIAVVEDSWW